MMAVSTGSEHSAVWGSEENTDFQPRRPTNPQSCCLGHEKQWFSLCLFPENVNLFEKLIQ